MLAFTMLTSLVTGLGVGHRARRSGLAASGFRNAERGKRQFAREPRQEPAALALNGFRNGMLWMVVAQGALLAAMGVALGLAAAFAPTRVIGVCCTARKPSIRRCSRSSRCCCSRLPPGPVSYRPCRRRGWTRWGHSGTNNRRGVQLRLGIRPSSRTTSGHSSRNPYCGRRRRFAPRSDGHLES